MDIQLRYDQNRFGGYQIKPVKVHKKDMKDLRNTYLTNVGFFYAEMKVIVGRMLSHPKFKKCLVLDKKGYMMLLEMESVSGEKSSILLLTDRNESRMGVYLVKYIEDGSGFDAKIWKWFGGQLANLPVSECKIPQGGSGYGGIARFDVVNGSGEELALAHWSSASSSPERDGGNIPPEGFW